MAIFFRKIRWKNFISTGNQFTEIDLSRNKSTLIVGDNGAGKSTILDALSFALYGKPFRNVNKPQLINSITQKNTLVEIEFTVGNNEYLIRRGIKPGIFEIFCNDSLMNQDADARDYQEYLEKSVLKLNHKSFNQIVVLGSANFVPFMQLPAGVRRQVIEDLLDIQIFSTMNTLLKEKVQENKDSIIETDFEIKNLADKIELQKKHLADLQQNKDDLIAQKQGKIDEFNSEIQESEQKVSGLLQESKDASDSISDQSKVRTRKEKLFHLLQQVDSKITKLKNNVTFFQENNDCPTCRQGIQHEHRTEIVDRSNSKIREVEQGKQKIQDELNNLNTRITEISGVLEKITRNNNEVMTLNAQITTKRNFVNTLTTEIEELKKQSDTQEDNNDVLQKLKDELKTSIAQKEQLQKDKQVLDVAAVLLKDGGIKTKIIRQYIPIINKLINKYLSAMEFFVNFELNENFEETIKSRYRDEFSYASFSEGEKMRIDLSLLFAWRAVAKLRNSSSTNLLIMDEVFDSSLDSSGTDEFIKILNNLTQDTNVFIISHKGDQLYDKFHSVIKFEKHKNFSRIAS